MTISSSLNAGVAGLAANATRLGTISDNIANSATKGYKRVETDFSSMVIASNGSGYTAGGVRTTTTRIIDQSGALVGTSNATDIAVRGNGFIPVAEATEFAATGDPQMFLTTTGSFRVDADGYLRTESGLLLMGWPANSDGSLASYARDTAESLEPVRINRNQVTSEPTTAITLGANLAASATDFDATGAPEVLPIEYIDNLGRSETLTVTFTPTIPATGSSNEWTMTIVDSATSAGGNPVGEYTVTFNTGAADGGTLSTVTTTTGGTYNATDGTIIVTTNGGPVEITIGAPGTSGGLTQVGDSFKALNISKDGSAAGSMTTVEIDENGFVHALFDTGASRVIYQVPLVDVPNPNGLISMDKQIYMPSPESGSFFLWDAGDGPVGDVVPFAREESSTDVANELTAMIQTQRAYSSNAKVIQTVDEMLQETTNIKR
ncbi:MULTISPECIES: flagellar hook protein FlgE [Mameliella]|jgi:flagellar hook protein FlgE|uniref:Flagellar hook protein FlgE n=1 Tax=Mameliella alba TaxID=561184 RepID=A0A0B3RWK0_9RHOB|nr:MULTISPECIES: flagellar hook-basal body complex protein [Mameliella]MCR9273130.1 flagellar hook-basal body complex protein [Paracoccaceae bacterium]ODM45918.1 flagellar biosynthesis protein FlgE [Ruegeria sp. PBVC088]KHQ52457.1 putative Flagellar hook protein FlgE [Mameliella alba]MBY6120603.1 flagellar hook-basal body complex protein [Mameliella alba]MDD9731974.1 flagellar hook-basal body complex protein [Mameliella sp. AT18]